MATETILWGKWDCTTCQTKGVSGKLKQCPHCGDPRGQAELDNVYLEEGAPIVTKPEELALARAGADWTCLYCMSNNRGDTRTCRNCGGVVGRRPSTAAPAPAPAPAVKKALAPPPRSGSKTAWTCKYCYVNNRRSYTHCRWCDKVKAVAPDVEWKKWDWRRIEWRRFNPANWGLPWGRWIRDPNVIIFLIMLVICGLVGLHYLWQRMTDEIIGTVTAQNWSQTVNLYEWVPAEGGCWGQPVERPEEIKPVDGMGGLGSISNVSCRQKHHHYETYQCGTKTEHYTVRESCGTRQSCTNRNNHNGSFSRSCRSVTQYCSKSKTRSVPKYCERSITAEWCDYDTQDWRVNRGRSRTFTGTEASEMAWPEVQAKGDLEHTKREGTWEVVFSFEHRGSPAEHKNKLFRGLEFQNWPMGTEVVVTIEKSGRVLRVRKTTDPPPEK